MLRFYPDKELAIYSIGVLHAIALIPAVFLSGQRIVPAAVAVIACVLYPFWGLPSMLVVGLGAPFIHSLIWGAVLCVTLRRPVALAYMSCVGVLTSVGIYFIFEHDINVTGASNDYGLSGMITIWHVLMLFMFPLIVRHKPRPWPDYSYDRRACHYCGYSLMGLGDEPTCPECGTVHHA